MKRIATMQDLSCVGKCSLSVVIPVLAAMGIETAAIPTAVLSANSAFPGFTFRELTKDIPGILQHWKRIDLSFDAIYIGYLGNARQAELVKELFASFPSPSSDKAGASLRIIDPAMADNGKLYRGVSSDIIGAMRKLVSLAGVITPNLTEGCLLTGTMYREDMNSDEIGELILKLSQLGGTDDDPYPELTRPVRRSVILTGMSMHEGELGAVCYDAQTGEFAGCYNDQIPGHFHGTGDIFTAVVTGALTLGFPLQDATQLAVDFTYESIRHTLEIPERERTGVSFEAALPWLIGRLAG